MAVNDRTVSSRQLAARWFTATDESRFNLWGHDGCIRVRRYAGERCLPEWVIERHNGLAPGIMVNWADIKNCVEFLSKEMTVIKFDDNCLLEEISGLKVHWCAKIKDEVEKLAYQLNEEAERTERPIRRLSKVMYGSTCADMQVDVMGECLSSIKHVVGVRSVFLAKRLHAV
ncbi:uncharacterized protein TNCV_1147281 [Trichonephila clavipes]|nr:uncharacterized protein TNCV_1147281 [Trichonephila clavipes]